MLDKQLLERLITERVLLQYAKETGIRVDDTQVERTIARIAQDNKLSADDFRKAVEREGIPYAKYREDIRNEITIQRLREREVEGRITVSDAEVDNFLATLNAQTGGEVEYRLAHILVLVPEQASPDQIDVQAPPRGGGAEAGRGRHRFRQVAAGFSDAPDALKGGNLGWRAPARLPTVFAEPVRRMKPGEVSGVLRSAAGFHIVKLHEMRSRNAPTVVEQTRARHILIKVNEITSEAKARSRSTGSGTGSSGREVRGAGEAELRGRERRQGRRSRLDLARRHGARLRAGDEGAAQAARSPRRCARRSAGT